MSPFRIALANLRFPATPEESVQLAEHAVAEAAAAGAGIVCFPECFVPGYRGPGKSIPPPDAGFLDRAWAAIARAAATADMTVILGTERVVDGRLHATALVIGPDGAMAGFQDKVQIDPSEEGTYTPGSGRRLFHAGPVTFGLPSATRAGGIRRRSAGPHGAGPTSSSTRTSTPRSPGRTGRRRSPTRRTRSTRRRPCAGRPRTPAPSRPSTAPAQAPRRRRRSSARTGRS